ncbi:hypothetical protein [Sutcliffiella deserti]|uniref:hypothetical protein n=1 Tax=Sutcliffiella deserti TaxID=2875501 RepID=UPI001CC07C04|nr:hypothetical protein [Sutcliffiella deserti]
MTEKPKIPKLELEKFTFSPPGPMGWNMAEYEQLLEKSEELVLNESTINAHLQSLQGVQLVEFSLSGELKSEQTGLNAQLPLEVEEEVEVEAEQVSEIVMEETVAEEDQEEDTKEPVPKNRITIIIKEPSLKTPWISPVLSFSKKQ